VLLERDKELQLLSDQLAGVASTGGKVVLLRGEAGIGKSSLVREFLGTRANQAHIHLGSCDDLLTPRALGPFWDIAREEPSLAESLRAGDRAGVLEATLDLLSRSLRPTILVIEDTHWADEATLDAIKYLGRRIAGTNGILLVTYRDGEVDYDHPLRGVMGDLPPEWVTRIQLTGLSYEAVSAIVLRAGLDPNKVLAATHGNPFLVTEMSSTRGDDVPFSVQDSVMARARRLSQDAFDLLKMLSVIPERITHSEIAGIAGAVESGLAECEQRGLLDIGGEFVSFHHELMRRAVEASLTTVERVATNRLVLEGLPADTDPARLVHHAHAANDIDTLLDVAPKAARSAAAVGSHREAVEHFRLVASYRARLGPDELGPFLDDWTLEEFLVDNNAKAIELNEQALIHYRESGDRRGESRALAQAAHLFEVAGARRSAEERAQQAVEVLGEEPQGSDLARALEANAFLQMMAGDVAGTLALVDQTLEAAGIAADERVIVRSLNHRGIVANIANYPDGVAALEESRERSAAAGQWYEEVRALVNLTWSAAEFRDLAPASDYARKAVAAATRHEIPTLERYAAALLARVLDHQGEWSAAEDLARDQLDGGVLTQMVALPVIGSIEARTGRAAADATLNRAWELSFAADEFQRLAPAATAVVEHAWISGTAEFPAEDVRRVVEIGLGKGFSWSPGSIAFWLWKLGGLEDIPDGIAEPYRLVIEGDPMGAAAMWAVVGCPYERAIALTHGDEAAQLESLDVLEGLGASAVAAKVRMDLRAEGVTVPRGKGRATRANAAGLTSRQAEVLSLLAEGLSNPGIADRLFLSPRTVENHVAAVISKLDVSTRDEAVAVAKSQGLLASIQADAQK
jgi:DNA-binding CsgD family transcriptional regulator